MKELTITEDSLEQDKDIRMLYMNLKYIREFKKFDYSGYFIEPIDKILKKYDADVLIIVDGFDIIPTSSEKVLGADGKGIELLFIIGLSSIGIYGADSLSNDAGASLSLDFIIVESSGKFIEYKSAVVKPSGWLTREVLIQGIYDFRDPKKASEFINKAISDFPKGIGK